jgi:hypothetical protein
MFNSNQAFLLVQILKSGPRSEKENIFSICPKLPINAELYGLVLAPKLKKGYHQIWEAQFATPWGLMFQHLLALPTKFRFIIEYSSLRDFGP